MLHEEKIINQTKEYFICEVCGGGGSVENAKCPNCSGYALGFYGHNDFLYWGKVVNQVAIWQNKLHLKIEQTINALLFITAGICFGVFVFDLYLMGVEAVFTKEFWLRRSLMLFVFWVGMLLNLFIYYRLERQSRLRYLVKYQGYTDKPMEDDLPISVSNWEDVKMLKPETKIDVSVAYHKTSLEVVEQAYHLAKKFKHNQVTTLHLLASLLFDKEAITVFGRLGVDFTKIRNKISAALNSIQQEEGRIDFSIGLRAVLIEAYEEAYYGKISQVGVGELLIVIAKKELNYQYYNNKSHEIDDKYRKISKEILYDLEIDEQKIKNVVYWLRMQKELYARWQHLQGKATLRPKNNLDKAYTAVATPYLNQICTDLTRQAAIGNLDLCVGRDKEIKEIFRLIDGGKTGFILVGFPGSGKRSIMEGIAQLIVTEDVPVRLQDKRLLGLSVAQLISNASPSEAAGRLMHVVDEIVRSRNIVLFIENVEGMGGITSGSEQSIDLSDVLAKVVSQNMFITFATTDNQSYSSYIENDNLGQVMQKINVREMSDNDTILVLESKSGFIEAKQQVFFSYGALEKTVKLTKRYVLDRYFPEKAISIIEETAVYVRNKKGKNSIVTNEDVAYIISQKVNIPLTKVTEEESDKLLRIEDEMHERMIGQEEAVTLVAEALRRARAGLSDTKRPIANFLFLGPTGVGKTELAKTVAETYFDSENNMIRLDMSEYQEQSSVYRLIGVPGSKEGGLLTEAIRKNPFCLLLLDELEKAHPDILNVFLQVMDDGRLTDSLGRTVSFTNVIIIATSNAGTQFIQDKVRENWELSKIKEYLMHQELKTFFRPEFLNRFDGIVVFRPLTMPDMIAITKLLLKKIAGRLVAKGLNMEFTQKIVEELAVAGYDPAFGARPLRRVLQDRVDNVLATYLLQNKLDRRDVVVLDAGGQISIRKAERF
jgi:ATP-dependent Clp protease ATP-binding subunit ClpC